ncbi:hypothetical protein [Bradyrhizobium sp. Tv2a-2]|uniref:hypothetical protein n=1 Tax=Bradyrhizobium sp. Tv2a-2 TaxID=113395 RepID=UPI000400E811|nr:hypothetical protein [Bradyrhizobium sp. Tv2a-2]
MSETIEVAWHHEMVGVRLIEAASTIRRMPMRVWPKEYGTIWPTYNPMTPSELHALKNEIMQVGGEAALREWEREQNRVVIQPSSVEIERATEALAWPMRYLLNDRETAQAVGFWASTTFDIEEAEIPSFVREGLKVISRGLKQDRVPVRA